jgi:uncharacterized protein YjbI with pentapeptide repeats
LCSGNVVRSHWIGFKLDNSIFIPLTIVLVSDLLHSVAHHEVNRNWTKTGLMLDTKWLTMAATIRASTKGLEEVDKARRKKGWTKSDSAWADLAITSVSTLRRFWAGLAIQSDTFKAICEVAGIKDWESVGDFENGKDLSLNAIYEKRLSFAIAGSIEEIDKHKLDAIVALLQKLGGDTSIEVLDIDEGSIKLILGGSPEALKKIEALFRSGALTEVSGSSVQDVHFLEKVHLIVLIKKNGGTALNLSRVDLSRADLRGANLDGANLRGANLSGANLSRVKLFRASMIEADLSGAYLGQANLREANLSEVNLYDAYLSGADLSGADLSGADLSGATLGVVYGARASVLDRPLTANRDSGANLSGANLLGANLLGANLLGANLSGARFGNNVGLIELDKLYMEERGALFLDSPESDLPDFVKP